jgi:hypothetical protein
VTPQDLIADISKTHGHCDLGYTASCRDPLPEPVTEAYVIAYTVTDAR